MTRKYYQGIFVPKFPKKYKGDVNNIVYRSGWEARVMKWLDTNTNVIEWCSEELVIPYLDPTTGKHRRYFPDFVIRVKTPDNRIKTYMLEVKPAYQTKEPPKKKRVTKKYINEVTTWGVNEAKWEKAKEYCADRGWSFLLITEKELGL
jgi:TnsA endonuclease N terminal